MQYFASLLFKFFRRIFRNVLKFIVWLFCVFKFYFHNVKHKSFRTNGLPFISIAIGGECKIDSGFKMNNNMTGNPIGRSQQCVFFVDKGAKLIIGKNVGISATAIIAYENITICDNVKIGGGVCIYDTDFHSLNPEIRLNSKSDILNKTTIPVFINENVFIGAHSTILKGVNIGKNAIIGACSVVTKNVPENEIWAGNPARKIKNVITDK